MEYVEFHWLNDESSFKDGIKSVLNCSGQLLKKHFSSKQLDRPIRARDFSKLPIDLVNNLSINPVYHGPDVNIIADHPLYLAVHKPFNIHSHPHSYSDKNTLLNFLAHKEMWDSLKVNQSHYDRGLLYRLDFETSGVILLAKSDKTLAIVRDDFAHQMKRKFYWAVVNGSFNQEGSWTHYFKATGVKGSKQKVLDDPNPDLVPGTLSVLKVAEAQGKSLVLVNLKSGLRHQIRAQLAHLGFPILGDSLYGGTQEQRLFLHALRYEWVDVVEDAQAELFDRFFDLDSALQVSHDMLGRF